MKILIYEDGKYKNLFPLSMLRGVFDIKIGINSIKERIEYISGNKFDTELLCRKSIASYLSEIHCNKINQITKDNYLLLNGRVIFSETSLKYLLSKKDKNSFYVFNNEIIAAFISKDISMQLKSSLENSNEGVISNELLTGLKLDQINLEDDFEVTVVNYPWDIVNYILHNGLSDDFNYFNIENKKYLKQKDQKEKEHLINYKDIHISKTAILKSNVVLDASEGKIIIDENAVIEPFTYIKGPAYIGKNSLLKSGTKIYGPCVIGENSKVSGEIAESVFHSYVNKQHDGFIGHSYICPFVNLGADTVTSDLKNNYSKIKINFNKEGKEINTGMQLLGSIIGDHSKTSINTMLNTGTIIGIFANIFGGGFPDKVIESFAWFDSGKNSDEIQPKYDLDKAIETAKIVMKRRNLDLSRNYEDLVKIYY
jgi:UDP-N-acetylglucosamine diphosphorylase/glucosamine-1-phosphate N-acetyltransferase